MSAVDHRGCPILERSIQPTWSEKVSVLPVTLVHAVQKKSLSVATMDLEVCLILLLE